MAILDSGNVVRWVGWVNSWAGLKRKGAGDSSNSLDIVRNTDWTQGNPQSAAMLFGSQIVLVQSEKLLSIKIIY
jgi:hypothetical protein